MTDETLAEMLERTADRTEVGAPPMNQMYAAAQRSRRRRGAWTALASAAAVATVIGGLAVLSPGEGGEPPVAEPGLVTPAPGMRLVGMQNIAVEVPKDWGTNALRCHAVSRNTVVLDPGTRQDCVAVRPEGVLSLSVGLREREKTTGRFFREVDIDGVRAFRRSTICAEVGFAGSACSGSLRFPDQRVSLEAVSSTKDQARAQAEVDEILSRVVVLPEGQTTIPGRTEARAVTSSPASGSTFAKLLEDRGLVPRVEYVAGSGLPTGYVLGTTPAAGEVVSTGEQVTVRIAKNNPVPGTSP
ncbi:MAG TPA: PASTA domain-containing protein [Nocardioides sp.]